jgi:hypothetical protein
MSKSKVLIIVAIVGGVVIAASLAAFFMSKEQVSPDQAFEKYQKNSLALATLSEKEFVSPANEKSKQDIQGSFDLNNKKLEIYGELDCKVDSSNGTFGLKFGLYQNGSKASLAFLGATGTWVIEGEQVNTQEALQPILGKWFAIPDVDKAAEEQLNNQVIFGSTNVYAPKKNADDIYKSLTENNVFTYTNAVALEENGKKYFTYTVTTQKAAYVKFLEKAFPELKEKDLIIDGVFGEGKDSIVTELKVSGETFLEVSSTYRSENYCATYIQEFIGVEDSTLPSEIGIKSEVVPQSDIQFTAPTDTLPLEQLSELLQ